jgi:hypothetical protein
VPWKGQSPKAQAKKELDAAKKLIEDEKKCVVACKVTAKDACTKKRVTHRNAKASIKQLDALSNALELERSCHKDQ